jgi:hypothetical protein
MSKIIYYEKLFANENYSEEVNKLFSLFDDNYLKEQLRLQWQATWESGNNPSSKRRYSVLSIYKQVDFCNLPHGWHLLCIK